MGLEANLNSVQLPVLGGMSGLRVFVALAVSAAAADALRCNTYIGTDFSSSGAGIETCTYATKCIQRKYYVLGVRTYQMSCDDLLQCHDQPANVCCSAVSSRRTGVR